MRDIPPVRAFVLAASLCAVSVHFGVRPVSALPEQNTATASSDYASLTSMVDQARYSTPANRTRGDAVRAYR